MSAYEKGLKTMGDQYDISHNSQKLFNYLVCLGGNPPNMQQRVFQHKNVNLSEISRTIGLSVNSIKKYWWKLEKNGKVIYGNNGEEPEEAVKLKKKIMEESYPGKTFWELTEEEDYKIWLKLWTIRKKRPCEYYTTRPGCKARNIPKETLKIMNEKLKFSEQDFKLYQFLLTYREVGIERMYKTFDFSMMDLRVFLGKKKEQKTHISIYKSLLLLQKYKLIDFYEKIELNSKHKKIKHYILTNVNFYIDSKYIDCEEDEREYIDQNIRQEIEERISQIKDDDL